MVLNFSKKIAFYLNVFIYNFLALLLRISYRGDPTFWWPGRGSQLVRAGLFKDKWQNRVTCLFRVRCVAHLTLNGTTSQSSFIWPRTKLTINRKTTRRNCATNLGNCKLGHLYEFCWRGELLC